MNKHRFCVAPMMQYTDLHDRFFLRLISKNIYLYTEMISTGSIVFGNCLHQFDFNKEEHPVAVQLGGSNPNHLSECSKIAQDYGYDEVNLNVGCPSERVQKGRFGAILMKEPNLVADCVKAMIKNTHLPITVKCRIGVDDMNEDTELDNFINHVNSFMNITDRSDIDKLQAYMEITRFGAFITDCYYQRSNFLFNTV